MNQNDVRASGCVKDVCLRIVASTEILMVGIMLLLQVADHAI